jgi:hypothetical protein
LALNFKELEELIIDVQTKISEEITFANRTGRLEKVLEKYGLGYEENYYPYIDISRSKILVLGYSEVSLNDLYGVFKKYGIYKKDIDIVCDYDKLPNYQCGDLRCSSKYSDIFIGPLPHKMSGIGQYKSLISMIEDKPDDFGKLYKFDDTGKLKITKEALKRAILQSIKYKESTRI